MCNSKPIRNATVFAIPVLWATSMGRGIKTATPDYASPHAMPAEEIQYLVFIPLLVVLPIPITSLLHYVCNFNLNLISIRLSPSVR